MNHSKLLRICSSLTALFVSSVCILCSCVGKNEKDYRPLHMQNIETVSEILLMSRIEEDYYFETKTESGFFDTDHFQFAQKSVNQTCYIDMEDLELFEYREQDNLCLTIKNIGKAIKWKKYDAEISGDEKRSYISDNDDYWEKQYPNDFGNRLFGILDAKIDTRIKKDQELVKELAKKKLELFYQKIGYQEITFTE